MDEPNPAYRLVEKGAVLNWWDIIEINGHCSLNSRLKEVIDSAGIEKTETLLRPFFGEGTPVSADLLNMMNNMTVLRIINLIAGAMHVDITKEALLELNAELNKIAVK